MFRGRYPGMKPCRKRFKVFFAFVVMFCFGRGSALAQEAIELKPGGAIPAQLQTVLSKCMTSRAPLGRIFTVGDEAIIRVSDLFSNVQTGTLTLKVTSVDATAGTVELNGGDWIMNAMGNFIKTPDFGPGNKPQEMVPAVLELGKTWGTGWLEEGPGGRVGRARMEMEVVAIEKIRVPAGEFEVFKIEGRGWFGSGLPIRRQYWVVPGLNFPLRYEHVFEGPPGRIQTTYVDADRYELISLRQQRFDIKCDASMATKAY